MQDSAERLARVAAEVAREAGDLIRERVAAPRRVATKSRTVDLVTDTDRAAEALILERLRGRFPNHAALGEEAGFVAPADATRAARICWVIDPLDGTTNFAHGVPHFAVSIAAATAPEGFATVPSDWRRAHAIAGAVHDPMRDETFLAWEGGPALLGDQPIAVSTTVDLDRCLLATGFPYDRREHADAYLASWRALLVRARDVRRMGAAALDLAWVACGRVDGFWESGLHPWDVAAGSLLVRRAGGTVSDFAGANPGLDARRTLATNGRVHADLVAILRDAGGMATSGVV
jgi:myo-inositol-1(or 4)-monophosphatase